MAKKGRTTSKARLRASDIADIEKNIEAVRTERRIIGAPITEQPNEKLFFVDQKGITDAKERQDLKTRGLLLQKPLKIDEILTPNSAVPALSGRKQPSSKKKSAACRPKPAAPPKGANPPPQSTARPKKISDIWSQELASLGVKRTRPAKPIFKMASVKVPSAGASYRPTSEEHEKLIRKATDIEISKMEALEGFKMLVSPKMLTGASMSTIDAAVQDILWRKNDQNEDDDRKVESRVNQSILDGSKPECAPVQVAPRVVKKLTETDRNRKARQKARKAEEEERKKRRKFDLDLQKANSLSQQVKKELKEKEAVARKKPSHPRPKLVLGRLGSVPFVPPPLEVQLTEEIADSLRVLKPEGNLIVDRFKSFQQRALIVPINIGSKRSAKAKAASGSWRKKVKLVEKASHRNFV